MYYVYFIVHKYELYSSKSYNCICFIPNKTLFENQIVKKDTNILDSELSEECIDFIMFSLFVNNILGSRIAPILY